MAHHFVAGEGALFAQINGPNTVPVYLGCHQIGDVDQPDGDIELIYCPDEKAPSTFKVVGSVKGAAGAITTTVTTDVTDELDDLERVKCPFTLFVNMSKAGRKNVFTNADRTFVFGNTQVTSRGLTGLTARTPDDNTRSEQTFDISSEFLIRAFAPTISRQTITETSNINDITFCNDQRCRTDEDVAQDACETGYAVTDAPAGSPSATANVVATTNGSTWAATAADPFAVTEDIIAVECFEVSRDDVRVIVARGTTDGANPAEIAYSDDSGATWTAVDVGSVNGEFAPTRFSLFALNRDNVWMTSDGGYIYYSSDAAITWTAQESGSITSSAWNAIHFVDSDTGFVGGASNAMARTIDGGTTWSSITGPTARAANAVICVSVLDRNRIWVGYDSGHLYYTLDGGTTWSLRSFTGSGVGDVRDIDFFNELLGFMISDNASPVGTVHWTKDGGYTWETITTPTNVGLNALFVCDEWNFFVCGEAQGGTGFIAKGTV
jgi:photosystem II stability/assembly factor-like uncharacterized protein